MRVREVSRDYTLIYEKGNGLSHIIGKLLEGEEVEIETEYDGWVKIKDGGWVRASDTEPVTFSGGASSWNDLEDKPFYVESAERSVLLPETTVTLTASEERGGNFYLADFDFALENGAKYAVVWQGEEFEVTAAKYGEWNVGIGDPTGSFAEQPFAISYNLQEYKYFIFAAEAGDCSVSIMKITETVKAIDQKYLPEPMVLYAF